MSLVSTWRSDVYHLLLMFHEHIEDRIKFLVYSLPYFFKLPCIWRSECLGILTTCSVLLQMFHEISRFTHAAFRNSKLENILIYLKHQQQLYCHSALSVFGNLSLLQRLNENIKKRLKQNLFISECDYSWGWPKVMATHTKCREHIRGWDFKEQDVMI